MSIETFLSEIGNRMYNVLSGKFEDKPVVPSAELQRYPIIDKQEAIEILGRLQKYVSEQESNVDLHLGAPVAVVQAGGGETLEFLGGQYGGGASADVYNAPGNPEQIVMSTAVQLAKTLHNLEKTGIFEGKNPTLLNKVVTNIRELRTNEEELFESASVLRNIANAQGNISGLTIDASKLNDPVERNKYNKKLLNARKAHEEAKKNRKEIFGIVVPMISEGL